MKCVRDVAPVAMVSRILRVSCCVSVLMDAAPSVKVSIIAAIEI